MCSGSCVIRVGARTDVPKHSPGDVKLSKRPLTREVKCEDIEDVSPREKDCASSSSGDVVCAEEITLESRSGDIGPSYSSDDISDDTGEVNSRKAEHASSKIENEWLYGIWLEDSRRRQGIVKR